ncbi:MAG: TIGR00730 family Rossman fold protein, partial [Patescibacteria group bacterium]|nr:TIGR00730 family Rossman fold protein [Patescibacteria group bacterium]
MSISKTDIHSGEINTHLERINHEFADGFEFLKKYPKSVTVFGSSVAAPDQEDYSAAEQLAGRVVTELGYAVLTGGGPGIMEAANKGAYQAGGVSLGLNVSIPRERITNAYVTHAIKFAYFFSRKVMLSFAAEAYIFFPGGYGTFDELFSLLCLIQTGKIPHVPVILYDSKFWKPLKSFLGEDMFKGYGTIEEKDLDIFEITDSIDRALEIIKKAPVSEF